MLTAPVIRDVNALIHQQWNEFLCARTLLVGRKQGHRPVKKLCVGLLVVTIWLELCTSDGSSYHHHVHHPSSSSSSSSSTTISEHSHRHKLSPLWTILCTHPRCVKTKVVGPKVELYCTEPCLPWSTCLASPIRWIAWWFHQP